eukprot:CAMPEP_0194227956 /NCGR_PEP_ID=MMETSP0156-20130528/43126_1 /TAXON_ID=33649 /ORGANISM="Thalassionema nitzschioides, Strain L26-B" /LENGTH=833 /DNA_ID=CAMNT_0038960455 /DNA_START=10 /DNA_END=2513 /DNA_ORIENTATION=-
MTTTSSSSSSSSSIIITVGLDIGAESTKVVLGSRHNCSCEIIRNEVGGHTTPTAVSVAASSAKNRQIGATAQSSTCLKGLNRLLPGEETIHNNIRTALVFGTTFDVHHDEQTIQGMELSSSSSFRTALVFGTTFDVHHDEQTIQGMELSSSSSDAGGVSVTSVLAMLMRHIRTAQVESTLQRLSIPHDSYELEYNILLSAAPTNSSSSPSTTTTLLLDAAYAAGLSRARVVDTATAYQVCYQRKYPTNNNNDDNDDDAEKKNKKNKVVMVVDMGKTKRLPTNNDNDDDADKKKKVIMVVDMGKTQTTVVVLGPNKKTNEKEDDNEEATTGNNTMTVRSSIRSKTLGAGSVDLRLYQHFMENEIAAALLKKKNNASSLSNKSQHRLLEGCKKLKHLLSQLPEGQVTVENIMDVDLKLSLSAKVLQELCQPEAEELKRLLGRALSEADLVNNAEDEEELIVSSIEITGGGCRIPWVKETILEAVAAKTTTDSAAAAGAVLSYSLDDTSAALGAAVWGEEQQDNDNDEAAVLEETESRQTLRSFEEKLTEFDQNFQDKADLMNRIEAHILELRAAKHDRKYGKLLPQEELDRYLTEVEDWLFSETAEKATKDVMEQKWQDVQDQTTNKLAKDYFKAKQQDQADKDAEMEAEAKLAQAAAGEEDEQQEEDDHDNRRLPKKRRMEIVLKNKAEANELFGDGNYKFAAARYTKALSHCAKFVDQSPDDVTEVNSIRVSLNLNLALSYLKLEKPDQALRCCNDALALSDEKNTKALYRRACVYYEKKQWDKASEDIESAIRINNDEHNNNKAFAKLQQRIQAQVQRQKQKEKKMAKKMFG